MSDKPIWEGDMQGLRVRVHSDGSTEYKGATEWYETRESLLNKYDVPVVVALAKDIDKLRAENEALRSTSQVALAQGQRLCARLDKYKVEVEALRARLAKLEAASQGVDKACHGWDMGEVGHALANWRQARLEANGVGLNNTKGSGDGQTETLKGGEHG